MAESPNTITRIIEYLSKGTQVAHDSFTYKVAAIGSIPVFGVIVAAVLALKDKLQFVSNPRELLSTIDLSDGWSRTVQITIIVVWTWAVIALTIRHCRGREKSTVGIYEAALSRFPFVVIAWLGLFLIGVALWAITWVLEQVAGVVAVSVLVVILAIPLAIAWLLLFVLAIIAVVYVPVLAGVDETAGPSDLINRATGMVLARPIPTILTPVLGFFLAALIAGVFLQAVGWAAGWGLDPLAEEMLVEQRSFEPNLLALIHLASVFVVCWGPWGMAMGSVADYCKQTKADPAIERAPGLAKRLLTNNRLFGKKPAPVKTVSK